MTSLKRIETVKGRSKKKTEQNQLQPGNRKKEKKKKRNLIKRGKSKIKNKVE